MLRLPPLLAAGVALALACAAPAAASPSMDVGIADDRMLLKATPEAASEAVTNWRDLGIDVVRIHARWDEIAPSPQARTAPEGFDASDPNAAGYRWEALDRAVALVRASGMRVMLTVTGAGPVWGTQFPVKDNPRYKPDPAKFAAFSTAVAKRFGAEVDEYIVWNEPNVAYWLQPQNTCTRGRCTPFAPHHYRKLVNAADPAIRAADPGARVLIGALAPRGSNGKSTNAQLRPLAFLRSMGCVNSRYKRVRSGYCRRFEPASGTGFAYHPHGLKLSPTQRSFNRDEAHIADLGRLVSVLDRVTRARGLRSRASGGRFPLYLTEYGYQTKPPDRVLGVSPGTQAKWTQHAAFLAYRHPRVRNLTQYAWIDEPIGRGGTGWQSGLHFLDGKPKPALASFPDPFYAYRSSRGVVSAWGQVRPGGATTVTLERRSGSSWRRVAEVRTNARGFFRRSVRTSATTTLRFRWEGGTSSARTVRRR